MIKIAIAQASFDATEKGGRLIWLEKRWLCTTAPEKFSGQARLRLGLLALHGVAFVGLLTTFLGPPFELSLTHPPPGLQGVHFPGVPPTNDLPVFGGDRPAGLPALGICHFLDVLRRFPLALVSCAHLCPRFGGMPRTALLLCHLGDGGRVWLIARTSLAPSLFLLLRHRLPLSAQKLPDLPLQTRLLDPLLNRFRTAAALGELAPMLV
jgi:hypothetical protein